MEELLHNLHLTSPQPNPRYYHLLTEYATTIILSVALRNQGVVAKDLGMSVQRLNNLMPLLKEFANDNT